MRWLLFIILLFPIALYAQMDAFQMEENDGLYREKLEDSNLNKIIFASSADIHIFDGSNDEEIKQDTLQVKNGKSPITAFILSLVGGATFLPGLGQHYNGEHNKGLRMGAVWLAGWIIAAGTVDRDNEKTGQAIGLPLVFAAFIWSCIDAPVSANKINKRLREQNTYGHMLEFYKKHYTFGFDLNISERVIGPRLTVHF